MMESSENPGKPGVAAIEAPEDHVHARRRRPWLGPALALVGGVVIASWLLIERCGTAQQHEDLEALTRDAHAFVAVVRSSLPDDWSIERVVEFPTIRPGSQALMGLRDQRGQARVNLEQKVLRTLPEAGQPDLSVWTPWIADPSWMPRDKVVAIAATLRELDVALTAARREAGLPPRPLPLDGSAPPAIPLPIELPALPEGVELLNTWVWALPPAVVVRRVGRKPGRCRDRAPACLHYQLTWVSWDGAVLDDVHVASPSETARSFDLGVGIDGTLYAVIARDADAVISSYGPGRPAAHAEVVVPELASRTFGYQRPDPEVITTTTGARLRVSTDQGERDYVLSADARVEATAEPADAYTFGLQYLEKRTGSTEPFALLDGFKLKVQRKHHVVFASVTPPDTSKPETVTRLVDLSPHDDHLLRGVYGTATRVALVLEGSKGAIKLLLSLDEGRTWTGAAL